MGIADIGRPAAWQVGLVVGGMAGAASLQPSISPRTQKQQMYTTGLSVGLGAGIATGISALTNLAAKKAPGGAIATFAGLAGVGLAAQVWSNSGDGKPSQRVGAVGSLGTVLAVTGAAGLGLIGLKAARQSIASRAPESLIARNSLAAVGAGLLITAAGVGALAWKFAHENSKPTPPSRVVGQAAIAAEHAKGAKLSDQPLPLLDTVSGSKNSTLKEDELGKYGKRFVHEAVSKEDITRIMGSGVDPIRIYAPLTSAATSAERVAIAIKEAEKLGVFDGTRDRILVATASGTGFIDPPSVQAEELMSRGNVATIAIQYADKPSTKSTGEVPVGAEETRMMIQALNARIKQMPTAQQPKLELFAESLGAWAQQKAYAEVGAQGLVKDGVDRALWVGVPYESTLNHDALKQLGTSENPGLLREFDRIENVEALSSNERDDLKFVSLAHKNDPVHTVNKWTIAYQRPDWLPAHGDKPAGVPQNEHFFPIVTGAQSVFDLINGTKPVPGNFKAHAHDYRADLAEFARVAYDHDDPADASSFVSRDQVQAITDELVRRELQRGLMLKANPGM